MMRVSKLYFELPLMILNQTLGVEGATLDLYWAPIVYRWVLLLMQEEMGVLVTKLISEEGGNTPIMPRYVHCCALAGLSGMRFRRDQESMMLGSSRMYVCRESYLHEDSFGIR